MIALTNCLIFTGNEIIRNQSILIEGKKIIDLAPPSNISKGVQIIDLGGKYVAPGFIDIQVNGGGGVLFNQKPTIKSLKTIVKSHRQFGTTDMLPTYITGSSQGMGKAAKSIQSYLDQDLPGILGIHFEGPFLNVEKKGAHDKNHIRSISSSDLEIIKSMGRGKTLLTLAPEMVDSEMIHQLSSQGILISCGHSNASYSEAMVAFESGATLTTHLFNAMSPFQSREPGLVGATLNHEDTWFSIIVDGFHVDYASIKIALRAKGQQEFPKSKRKMILITDAMPPVGDPLNRGYTLSGHEINVVNGRCIRKDGVLAGAALDMATAVRNCIQFVGLPIEEALRMATAYPAEFLGLEKELGYIGPGYRANLSIFDPEIKVTATVVNGDYVQNN